MPALDLPIVGGDYNTWGAKLNAALTTLAAAAGASQTRQRDIPGIHALPVLNPSPPGLTAGVSGAASAIAGSVLLAPDEPGAITYYGAAPKRGALYPDYGGIVASTTYTGSSSAPWAAEFVLDTADATGRFEIYQKGNSAGIRVLTRDKISGRWLYASQGASFTPGSDGAGYLQLVTLGAAGRYTVRLEMHANVVFFGLRVGPTDTVRATSRTGKRIIVVGDSFTEPTIMESGTSFVWDGWAQLLSYALGSDVWSAGCGGTGFLQTNAGRMKARDRLAADVIPYAPDEVWWALGINDSAFTSASIAAEALLCFQAIAAALPNAKQVVLSPFYPKGVASIIPAYILNHRDGIGANAAQSGFVFIDTISLPLPASTVSVTRTTTVAIVAAATNNVRVAGPWPVYSSGYIYLAPGDAALATVRKINNVTDDGDGTMTVQVVGGSFPLAYPAGTTVRLVGGSIYTGTGKQGTPVGDGNADRYTGSDGTHPTVLGHRNITDQVVELYRQQLPA